MYDVGDVDGVVCVEFVVPSLLSSMLRGQVTTPVAMGVLALDVVVCGPARRWWWWPGSFNIANLRPSSSFRILFPSHTESHNVTRLRLKASALASRQEQVSHVTACD